MEELKKVVLIGVEEEFNKYHYAPEQMYSSQERALKYASLMTLLEQHCDVPALEQDIQDPQSPEVVLYKQISEERNKYL